MKKFFQQLGGLILAFYAELLWKTCKIEIEGWELVEDIQTGETPFIVAAWHGQTHLLYPTFKGRLDLSRLAMPVVDDRRQAVLKVFARVVGAQTFPMISSDTTLAGARGMVALMQALKTGKFGYIAPDGPDGPPRVAKEGIAFLAARLNAWLLPIGAFCRVCLHIRRWDRYSLPLPFSRIRVVFGQPIRASRDMDRGQLLQELSQLMNSALMAAGQD